jgi:hypothetical protein
MGLAENRWKDYTKMGLKEKGFKNVDPIHLAHDRV